ncbi:MAG: sugar phosphate isomerase/epimerase [Isosphaeraceae bacterium]|nr:sugar phosphate isomerase/epimerase [Isosphaeraceae bacterium]
MPPLTRRRFLAGVALAAAPLAWPRAARAIEPIGRTRPSHLKLSLAAYSYRQHLDFKNPKSPKLDMFGFVDLAADMGLDAVEPTSYWFPPDVDADYLHRLKLHAFKLGLDISGTAIRNDFCLPPGPKRDADREHIRTWIDRAAELDAPVIRVFGGSVPKGEDEDQVAERVIQGIEAVLPYAAEKGVALALENHGGITETPRQLLRLVRGVKAPQGNFGVNLDTGNFRGDDPYAEVAELAPYAINVQVKTEISRRGKKEEADLSRIIGILREAKYSGYVVLEYEAKEDPMTAVPKIIKTLRSLIG